MNRTGCMVLFLPFTVVLLTGLALFTVIINRTNQNQSLCNNTNCYASTDFNTTTTNETGIFDTNAQTIIPLFDLENTTALPTIAPPTVTHTSFITPADRAITTQRPTASIPNSLNPTENKLVTVGQCLKNFLHGYATEFAETAGIKLNLYDPTYD